MIEILGFCHTMNDDDTDFKPSQSTSSNLTSLFDTNRPRSSENQSLIYVPPKAPKSGESSSTVKRDSSSRSLSNDKLEIITTKSVQVHKLENGSYVSQGTAGITLVGNYDLHIYQIILYKNNKEYLSKTHVSPNFVFTVLENNYASFYDNSRQNWSVLYSSPADVQQFAKQVAVAKYNSHSKTEKVVVQDLIPLTGNKRKENDIIKVSYTCSTLKKDEIIPFTGNTSLFVESIDINNCPWQEGLKDCTEKCKRVVITPYKLSAPWTNDIEQNSSVLIEFEVDSITPSQSGEQQEVKEKIGEKQNEKMKPEKTTKVQEESTTDTSSADEDNCKGKGTSLKDSIFLSRSHKTNLISRIAKMGQGLQMKGGMLSGPSDSEEEGCTSSRRVNKLRAVNNAVQQLHQTLPMHRQPCSSPTGTNKATSSVNNPVCKYEIDVSWQQQQMKSGINFACQQLYPYSNEAPSSSSKENDKKQVGESSNTDAELRLTISKVSEKVDHVLDKLQNLNIGSWDKLKEHQTANVLDPVSVINSIHGIVAENDVLKAEIQQQKSKIDEQNSKIQNLMELTQRCVEKCAVPEKKQPAAAERINNLETRLNTSDQLMSITNDRMTQLALDVKKYIKEIFENQKQNRESNAQVNDLLNKLKEKDEVLHNVKEELAHTIAENEVLANLNEEQKREIMRYRRQDLGETSTGSREPQIPSSEDSFEEIKKVMNAVNKKLQACFEPDKNYSGSEVKDIIATTIKDVTMEYLRYKSRQKVASKVDFQQKEETRVPTDTRRGSTRTSTDLASSSLEYGDEDYVRYDRSRRPTEIGKVGSHRLTFVEDQTSYTGNSVVKDRLEDGRAQEEHKKSITDLKRPSAGRMASQTSARPSENVSFLQRPSDVQRTASERGYEDSKRIIDVKKSRTQMSKESGMHSREAVPDEENDMVHRKSTVEYGARTRSDLLSKTVSGATRTSAAEPRFEGSVAPLTAQASAGYHSLPSKEDNLSDADETSPFNEDDENVEIEKSVVMLNKTVSDVTKDHISETPSLVFGRDQVSVMDSSIKDNAVSLSDTRKRTISDYTNNVETSQPSADPSKVVSTTRGSVNTPTYSRKTSGIVETQTSTSLRNSVADESKGGVSDEGENLNLQVSGVTQSKTESLVSPSATQPPSRRITSQSIKYQGSGMDKSMKNDTPVNRSRIETIIEAEGVENVEVEESAVNLNSTISYTTKYQETSSLSHRSTVTSQMLEEEETMKENDGTERRRTEDNIQGSQEPRSSYIQKADSSSLRGTSSDQYSRRFTPTPKSQISEMSRSTKEDDFSSLSRVGTFKEEGADKERVEENGVDDEQIEESSSRNGRFEEKRAEDTWAKGKGGEEGIKEEQVEERSPEGTTKEGFEEERVENAGVKEEWAEDEEVEKVTLTSSSITSIPTVGVVVGTRSHISNVSTEEPVLEVVENSRVGTASSIGMKTMSERGGMDVDLDKTGGILGNTESETSKYVTPQKSIQRSTTVTGQVAEIERSATQNDVIRRSKSTVLIEVGDQDDQNIEDSRTATNRTESNTTKGTATRRSTANEILSEANVDKTLSNDPETDAKEGVDDFFSASEEVKSVESAGVVSQTGDEVKDVENDNDGADKSSMDEKEGSSTSQENIKNSGSNAVYESCNFSNYYQNWRSSNPPPLPIGDDDDSGNSDEEWL